MLNAYQFNATIYNGRASVSRGGLFSNMIRNFISKIGLYAYNLWGYISKIGLFGLSIRNFISTTGLFVWNIRNYISKIGLFDYLLEGIKNATKSIFNEFKVKFRVKMK